MQRLIHILRPSWITKVSGHHSCDCSAGYFWHTIIKICDLCASNLKLVYQRDVILVHYANLVLLMPICMCIYVSFRVFNEFSRSDVYKVLMSCLKLQSFKYKGSSRCSGFTVAIGADTSLYPGYTRTDPLATH